MFRYSITLVKSLSPGPCSLKQNSPIPITNLFKCTNPKHFLNILLNRIRKMNPKFKVAFKNFLQVLRQPNGKINPIV